jgi:septal ring factor EnvC (AmiA/AmiB activator)
LPGVSKSTFYPGANRLLTSASTNKLMKKQETIVQKESQISLMKIKLKELNEALGQKDKELSDLKQTLKFTRVKEYEAELQLNVQESQRLRDLL